jgi:hypothetical protein
MRLGVTPQELPADPLELVRDGQVGGVQGDVAPREAQHLAFPKPEHEDQHVGRVQRIVQAAG